MSATITTPEVIVLEDFLSPDEHQHLVEHARANRSSLAASGVLDSNEAGAVDHDVRRSMIGPTTADITASFSERLHALLPHMRKELDIPWFQLENVEVQFTAHGDGDFFAIHTDNGAGSTRSRKLTFVYYFHIPPQGFDGGELVVYDWKIENNELGPGAVAHRIQPADNTIVFFPSNAFHEVRPVECPGNDPDDHRFTVNGWFHAVPTIQDVTELDQITNMQRFAVSKLHDVGFELLDTPADLQARLVEAWQEHREEQRPEDGDPRPFPSGRPMQSPLSLDPNELLAELAGEHEVWAGTALDPVAVVGFRSFEAGQSERPHTLRVESHVITTIYCVDASTGGEPDLPPWPVYVVDHDGTEHELPLREGQALRYESASCPAGFPRPLAAGRVTLLMVHYRPTDWNWTERRVWERVRELGNTDG